jgi:flagellar basal-body rod protein FlgC
MEISSLFNSMNASASGMSAQRKRMNTIAENLANAETTRAANNEPYRRQQTILSEDRSFAQDLEAETMVHDKLERTDPDHLKGKTVVPDAESFHGVLATVQKDPAPFREVYDPAHPDADENGNVKMPNVDVIKEMTDLISAARDFEANVTAFNASKGMMKKALEL